MGRFRAARVEMVNHSADRKKWKNIRVITLDEVMEGGFDVTMGKHDLHNMSGDELAGTTKAMAFGNLGEQFRSNRCRDRPCFLEEAVAFRGR